MIDDEWLDIYTRTHSAVMDFARLEYSSMTRKVVYAMQRCPGSGIYGGDYNYKSQWDEYCHEVQNGPHDGLEVAWEQTLSAHAESVLGNLTKPKAILLSIYACWELDLDTDEYANLIGAVMIEEMLKVLISGVDGEASMRDLHKFGPWRNC